MKSPKTCAGQSLVDAHFKGNIARSDERALRAHLPECNLCRAYYERHLLLAKLDPKSQNASDRLARGLVVTGKSRQFTLILAAAAALVFAFIWFWPAPVAETGEFVARGSVMEQSPTLLQIDRAMPSEPAALINDEIGAQDELAFAYQNTLGKKYLLVFGIDEDKNVYWYHPEWRTQAENPTAISIAAQKGLHELPEAIQHQLQGNVLRIVGVFSNQLLTVKQVEQKILGLGKYSDPIAFPDAIQVIRSLKVRP